MALINPCLVTTQGSNTGVECGKKLASPAGIILVPEKAEWTASDLATFYDYIQSKAHAAVASRWYPIQADIKNIENNEQGDTIETFPDGSSAFVRYGNYDRIFSFKDGGTCLVQALMSFNKLGYAFLEFDNEGNIAMKLKENGKYAGFKPDEMYAPKPKLQDFSTTFLAKLYMSVSPVEYIQKAAIFQSEEDLSDLQGLLNVNVTTAGAASTTVLKVYLKTECAETDLVALVPAFAVAGAFVVTKVSDGTLPTISAVAVVGDHIELTGTFVSAAAYSVALASAATLLGLDIIGYEGLTAATITIP